MLDLGRKAKIWLFAFFMSAFILVSCSHYMPVPGGNETVNQYFYITQDDLFNKLKNVKVGMEKKEVFTTLSHGEEDFLRLKRNQIVTSLYGSSTIEFRDGKTVDEEDAVLFLQSLSGYSMNYKVVKRKHGFSSPIRLQTDEKGFDYTITLIFRDGFLYEQPLLTGGVVNNSSSKTFFDYFDPGRIIERSPY